MNLTVVSFNATGSVFLSLSLLLNSLIILSKFSLTDLWFTLKPMFGWFKRSAVPVQAATLCPLFVPLRSLRSNNVAALKNSMAAEGLCRRRHLCGRKYRLKNQAQRGCDRFIVGNMPSFKDTRNALLLR